MPPHEPTRATRELVQLHTMVGTRQEAIASIIGIDPKTLRKYYRDELDQSKASQRNNWRGAVQQSEVRRHTAMIFWMKTQGRLERNNSNRRYPKVYCEVTADMNPQDAAKAYQDLMNG